MYAWIWRHLPFGRSGKLVGSLLLVTAAMALLWYVVFPWAEPLLPFDDVQVTDDSGVPGWVPGRAPTPGGTPSVEPSIGEHDLPYSTHSDNPGPSATPDR